MAYIGAIRGEMSVLQRRVDSASFEIGMLAVHGERCAEPDDGVLAGGGRNFPGLSG